MAAYYNEIEPYAAEWLRNLIKHKHIADGDVDERSICAVDPKDIRNYTQVHFFAGIGGWSYALRRAGWPDDKPVWTGSCPCQPFSAAGQRKGVDDERHLWPEFYRLISECNPSVVFGEQVASKDGRSWLTNVRADLETMGYAVGAADLCAAGIGAPHIRQRLWWVADAGSGGSAARIPEQEQWQEGYAGKYDNGGCELFGGQASLAPAQSNPLNIHWQDADWLWCRDGKWRPVEPGTFPLAHGVPARVGRLRAYGNAIVPQVAVQFIGAYLGA